MDPFIKDIKYQQTWAEKESTTCPKSKSYCIYIFITVLVVELSFQNMIFRNYKCCFFTQVLQFYDLTEKKKGSDRKYMKMTKNNNFESTAVLKVCTIFRNLWF